jgi:hypothetical protein
MSSELPFRRQEMNEAESRRNEEEEEEEDEDEIDETV